MQNHQVDPEEEKSPEEKSAKRQRPVGAGTISYLHDIVFTLTIMLVILMFVFRINVVSGPSMMKTLVDGDYVLLLNSTFYRNPKAGDIIVASKQAFKDGEPIIKRVIATEGQQVDIDFDLGIVYVDGQALDEPYTNTLTQYNEGMEFPMTVEKGHIFVMGDNRNSSKDSRSPEIGLIDKREVMGKALFLFFPGRDPQTLQHNYSRIGVLS